MKDSKTEPEDPLKELSEQDFEVFHDKGGYGEDELLHELRGKFIWS